MKFTMDFGDQKPSYMLPNRFPSAPGTTEYDPFLKVTSKKPYLPEITTRTVVWDYYRTTLALPNPSEILQRLGRNIEEVDQLLVDGRVKACLNNRRSGSLSLKWTIDQNECPSRMLKCVENVFDSLPIYDLMSEMIMACFYGYNVTEVVWEYVDGLVLPTNLSGKGARWFAYSEDNELRIKTKANMVQGEPLPPRKFLVTRYHPRYDDPYAGREALFNACYWPVIWRRILQQYAMQFLAKYGMPWFDVTVDGDLQEDRLKEIMNSINQTYEDGVIIHPENTKIAKMDMDDAKTVENYTKWMDVLNREIDMSIMGNNLTMEVKGGSFAATNAHMSVRDDIVKEDSRMLEATFNQLIEWIVWYNFPTGSKLPKFRLYKSEPPTKERAEIDAIVIEKMGVRLDKEYICRTYGYDSDEITLIAPVAPEQVPTETSKEVEDITDAGISNKDAATSVETDKKEDKTELKGSGTP